MSRTLCIGDIHGNFKGLKQALERCNFDYNNDFLFNYLICDFMTIFEKRTIKFEYKKYNARDILLLEKINKIRCSKSVKM